MARFHRAGRRGCRKNTMSTTSAERPAEDGRKIGKIKKLEAGEFGSGIEGVGTRIVDPEAGTEIAVIAPDKAALKKVVNAHWPRAGFSGALCTEATLEPKE